jgi:hypothetical protein
MIAAIRAHLVEAVPALRLVAGGAEFAALAAPPAQLPAAYVMPWLSSGEPNSLAAGGFRQRIEETCAVFLFNKNLRDARGEAAMDQLDILIRQVRTALVGFVPGAGWEQMETRSGRVFDVENNVVVWQELFVSASQLRAA